MGKGGDHWKKMGERKWDKRDKKKIMTQGGKMVIKEASDETYLECVG